MAGRLGGAVIALAVVAVAVWLAVAVALVVGSGDDDGDSTVAAPAPETTSDSPLGASQDADTKSNLRNASSEMEVCYATEQTYGGCQPPGTGFTVAEQTDETYRLTARSGSGTEFVIAKTTDGAQNRTCSAPDKGGCLVGGRW